LLLRQDNADLRLTPMAAARGLVDAHRAGKSAAKTQAMNAAKEWLQQARHDGIPVERWLRRTENTWSALPWELRGQIPADLWPVVETDVKYAGYLLRQADQVARLQRQEDKPIPANLRYDEVHGLKLEARQKLAAIRPATLGQAGRILGVTPADLALLSVWIARHRPDPDS
jgi:tRNA uridine 5-carboxymethylaminomethyl modification enzyme